MAGASGMWKGEVGNEADKVIEGSCAGKFTLYPEGVRKSLKVRKKE